MHIITQCNAWVELENLSSTTRKNYKDKKKRTSAGIRQIQPKKKKNRKERKMSVY